MADLVADRKRLEYVSLQAEDERQQALTLLAQVEREKEELQRRKEEILAKARAEAQETVVRTKREAQRIFKELSKMAIKAQNEMPALKQIE